MSKRYVRARGNLPMTLTFGMTDLESVPLMWAGLALLVGSAWRDLSSARGSGASCWVCLAGTPCSAFMRINLCTWQIV